MKQSKIIIATGGTGGHLFPARQLAKQLKENQKQVLLAGNNGRFFDKLCDNFVTICSSSVRRRNFPLAACKITYGICQSIALIKKFQPTLIIGFGSFYSFPILVAARILRIPYIIYESNAVCGLVNRLFSKKALAFTAQFREIKKHKSKNVIVTSFLPWKTIKKVSKEKAIKKLNLKPSCFTLLIFGGSQGALFLNQLILSSLAQIKNKEIQMIHITGSNKLSEILKSKYEKFKISAFVAEFFEDIPLLCYAADLAICRSGAGTIGDLIQTFTPSILIPYPYATDNHQYLNAKILQDKIKGALTIKQKDLSIESLFNTIDSLLNNNCSKLHQMRENLEKYYAKENKIRKNLIQVVEKLC